MPTSRSPQMLELYSESHGRKLDEESSSVAPLADRVAAIDAQGEYCSGVKEAVRLR